MQPVCVPRVTALKVHIVVAVAVAASRSSRQVVFELYRSVIVLHFSVVASLNVSESLIESNVVVQPNDRLIIALTFKSHLNTHCLVDCMSFTHCRWIYLVESLLTSGINIEDWGDRIERRGSLPWEFLVVAFVLLYRGICHGAWPRATEAW
jgi:hypothetical protein